jgi:dTMP kinase
VLVVIEGPDAVGKNEMSTRLTEEIKRRGRSSTRISFPRYETPLGKLILMHLKNEVMLTDAWRLEGHEPDTKEVYRSKEDALAFQCMMVADKYHAASEISKLLRANADVVCDRYWQSAYAFGASDGLDEQWLLEIHEMMPKPDLNILLTLSPEEALERRPQMRDRYEMDREAQVRVRENYRKLWSKEMGKGSDAWGIVDAGRSRDEVFYDVLSIYDGRLSKINKFNDGTPA